MEAVQGHGARDGAGMGADSKAYAGKSLTLYRDDTVKWAGIAVGGIRISHMSDIEEELITATTLSKGSKKIIRVKPLQKQRSAPAPAQEKPKEETASKPEVLYEVDESKLHILLSSGPTYFEDFQAMETWLRNALDGVKSITNLTSFKERNKKNFEKQREIHEEWADVIQTVITDRERKLNVKTID